MRTWLLTGASGFLGRHVLDTLARGSTSGEIVVGLGRHAPSKARGIFVTANLDSSHETSAILAAIRPSIIIHAAGQTPPASSEEFFRSNTMATLHLLASLRAIGRPTRVVLVGSAAELGPVAIDRLPVNENETCRPVDFYGLSKLLATRAGLASKPPIDVISARIFNPIGPGLPETQALGRFARVIADSLDDPTRLEVGDLDARRDFLDVRDVASALVALARDGHPGTVYHVGSGVSRRVGDGLDNLIHRSGKRVTIVARPDLPIGPRDSRADITRIGRDVGWTPKISWEESLADLWAEASGGRH